MDNIPTYLLNMETKSVIISSSGLKNIVLNKYIDDDDFVFNFGEHQFQMKSFFAEFISPIVSHLHQTDPTINTINFRDLNTNKNEEFDKLTKAIVSSDTISLLIQISSGLSIDINEDQAIKLRFLSILLGNLELHSKLNELFPQTYTEKSVNYYLKNIDNFYNFSQYKTDFDFTSLLSFIASHFYAIDRNEFLKLSRNLQHQIISHPKLKIDSEDSLFDIIIEIIERKKENEEEIDDVLFLEQIEFKGLSEERLRIFVDLFDVNEMSNPLWRKLSECLFDSYSTKSKNIVNRCRSSIIVGGINYYNLFSLTSVNYNDGTSFVRHPQRSSLNPSFLLSYSVYESHSVLITNEGSMKGIGGNTDGRISNALTKTQMNHFTDFSMENLD